MPISCFLVTYLLGFLFCCIPIYYPTSLLCMRYGMWLNWREVQRYFLVVLYALLKHKRFWKFCLSLQHAIIPSKKFLWSCDVYLRGRVGQDGSKTYLQANHCAVSSQCCYYRWAISLLLRYLLWKWGGDAPNHCASSVSNRCMLNWIAFVFIQNRDAEIV